MPDEIGRLLRPGIVTVTDLAEEMYALLASDNPIKITSPVQIGPTGSVPPLTLTTNLTTNNTPVPAIVVDIKGPIVPAIPLPTTQTPFTPDSGGGGGNAYAGVVVSGTGATYTCSVQGSTGPAVNVSVTMPALSADATLAAGTPLVVLKIGAAYLGYPSVFYPAA